jgi:hypothetical protein
MEQTYNGKEGYDQIEFFSKNRTMATGLDSNKNERMTRCHRS